MKVALGLLVTAGVSLPLAFDAITFAAPRAMVTPSVAAAAVVQEDDNPAVDNETLVVWVETVGGREVASVRGRNVSLDHILRELARRTGRIVEGLSANQRGVLVSINLEDRPLEQVLEYVLGGVELAAVLSPDILRVVEDDSDQLSVDRLRDRSMALYLRATREHAGHPAAERGRLSQGELEEARGNLAGANEQYQSLIENYTSSAFRADAHLRSGLVLEKQGRWSEASQQFRQASSGSENEPEYVPARLGLARCQIELGNPDQARWMLEALNDAVPPTDGQDQAERGLVQARAELLRDYPVECLATLDQLDRAGLPEDRAAEAMRLRALAFEGMNLIDEAGRAWLVHARLAEGVERDTSFERAALIAMEEGDHLGVLFVVAQAEEAGSNAALAPVGRAARIALGLNVDLSGDDANDEERIATCEQWLEAGDYLSAKPVLATLHQRRTELHPTLRQRAALAWGRCLYRDAGLEAALSALREARPNIQDETERDALDLLAASLLEGERQWARADKAYEGLY